MRRIHLLLVASTVLILSVPSLADTPPEVPGVAASDAVLSPDAALVAANEATDELAWDQFDDPDFDPQPATKDAALEVESSALNAATEAAAAVEADLAVEAEEPTLANAEASDAVALQTSNGIVLGPQGIDDLGRTGRLHTVSSGDTLWDLSAAYLGTAWVWPSVWIDNDEIDNPHQIEPGDRIWITANEMRVVSDAEAESFLEQPVMGSEVVEDDTMPVAVIDDAALDADFMPPVEEALEVPVQPLAALETEADDPSALEAFPVAVPGQEPETMMPGRQVTISRRDAMGFVSAEDLAGATTLVDSPVERTFLAAGDPVVLGMGEGDVEVGDEFTIFRVVEEVRDVETHRILGHHIDILGWVVVRELTGDTSIGEIRTSYAEMRRGVRVMPRKVPSRRVTARSTPDAIEGKVVFLPSERTVMADGGYVYLNRGEFHGIEIGSELEVYEPGSIVNENARRVDVRTPDHRVAALVVVSVTENTSVAFVLSSSREIEVGDDVRPRIARLARR